MIVVERIHLIVGVMNNFVVRFVVVDAFVDVVVVVFFWEGVILAVLFLLANNEKVFFFTKAS